MNKIEKILTTNKSNHKNLKNLLSDVLLVLKKPVRMISSNHFSFLQSPDMTVFLYLLSLLGTRLFFVPMKNPAELSEIREQPGYYICLSCAPGHHKWS